jgi:hypothetical protein
MEREKYIHITEILGFFKDFSKIPPEILEKKTKIGTEVHVAIKSFFEDSFYPLEKEAEEYFNSFLMWAGELRKKEGKAEFTEVRLYDDDKEITGCLDLILSYPDSDEYILVDFKTTYLADNIFWPLQASFYLELAKKNNIPLKSKAIFVQLRKGDEIPLSHYFEIKKEHREICQMMKKIYLYLTKS